MPEQFLSTSRLGNVIQLIALGNQTGILKVTRGQGSTREQGEIHFANGQPTFAILGQLVGNAALTVLQNWGESQYLFLEGPLPQTERSSYGADPWGRFSEPSPPAAGGFGPRLVPRSPPVTGPSLPSLPAPTAPFSMPAGSPPGVPGGSGYLGNFPRGGTRDLRSGPLPTPPMRYEPLHAHFVPRRTASMERMDTLPLDRRERMVLLLIDGHRSVADLVRLTRRNEQEIQMLLSHLASLGLIE